MDYREANRRSVVVSVTVKSRPAYKLSIRTKTYADVVEAEENIFKFQVATVESLDITDGKQFLDNWLVTNTQKTSQSLDPFMLYPQLLAIRAVSSKTDTDNPAKAKRNLIIEALTPTNLRAWNSQAHAFRDSNKGSSNYYPTYIYCNYVLCLAEIRRLSRDRLNFASDNNGAESFDDIALDFLLEHAEKLAGNLDSNGNFYRYFNAPIGGYDRSVGMIALYTLIHLMDELKEFKAYVTTSSDAQDLNTSQLIQRIDNVASSLDKLAFSFRGAFKESAVSYDGAAGTNSRPNLAPGYFLASLVLYDRDRSTEQIAGNEFNEDMKLLKDLFRNDSTYPFDLGAEYGDAYRWMFWARVMERLKKYTITPKGQNDTEAKAALIELRNKFLFTVHVASIDPEGKDIGKTTLVRGLEAKRDYQSENVRDVLVMIALETARMEYLGESLIQPKTATSQASGGAN